MSRIRRPSRRAIAIFSSLYAFCHLADLRFLLFFLSFSHQARVFRPFPQTSTHSPALHPHPAPRREHRRHSSGRFLSDDGDSGSTTARELRRGARSRCPRRGEEEVLRIDKDMERRALNDQPLMSVSLWGTSALFRGWRMHYSSSPSRRRHRQATDDGTAAALHSRGHNRDRRCPGNTEELSKLWRTLDDGENLFSVFDSNDGALYVSSNPMATSLFHGFHGNALLRAWRQLSMLRLSIFRCQIRAWRCF